MDQKKMEELRAKAEEIIKSCQDLKDQNISYSEIKAKLSGVLNEIQKVNKEEKDALNEAGEKIREKIAEFMKADLIRLEAEAKKDIAACHDEKSLQDVKVSFLGKKGRLTAILRSMKDISGDERPKIGALANTVRNEIEGLDREKRAEIRNEKLEEQVRNESVDITLPARHRRSGHLHPLVMAEREIVNTFVRMGYSIEEGPEIESDYFNFECLNLPKDHPARDMQDSFYITPDILLRTHTSPVQARTMQKHEPNSPIRMICPGRVFRWDNDATHSPVFHQVEGLVVDKGIRFSDLKGTLEIFLKDLFGSDTRIRFRASYFPFTEPSAEVDISFASRTQEAEEDPEWLEILGCGMVHPKVLSLNGYDPDRVSGFAFGLGIERIAMLLYGIDDLRNFYENDTRFLNQF